jgi:hypothetical protein
MWTMGARKMGKAGATLLVAAALAGLSGCANDKDKSSTPPPAQPGTHTTVPQGPQASAQPVKVINTMCPIGGDDFGGGTHDAALSRAYKGKEIGFCCANCVRKFDAMTDEQKDQVLKLATANAAP